MEARIRGIQRSLENMDYASLTLLEKELQDGLNLVLFQEELLWFQKSREIWVQFGDRNTKYFHIQTLVRGKHNKIHGLFLDNGTWSTNPTQLK